MRSVAPFASTCNAKANDLLDTNVLVGLTDDRDAHHKRASADLERLRGKTLGMTTLVLGESCFFLRHRSQRERLRRIIRDLSIEAYALPAEDALWQSVFDWFAKYAEHAPDLTDAVLVVLSGLDPRVRIWTYDSEFTRIWRRPDGSAVPLVVRP